MFSSIGSPPQPQDSDNPWVIHGSFQSESDDESIVWEIDTDGSTTDTWLGGTIAFTFDDGSTVVGSTDGSLTSGVAVSINQGFTVTIASTSDVVHWTATGPDGSTYVSWGASISFGVYFVTLQPGSPPPSASGGAHVGLVADNTPGGGDV